MFLICLRPWKSGIAWERFRLLEFSRDPFGGRYYFYIKILNWVIHSKAIPISLPYWWHSASLFFGRGCAGILNELNSDLKSQHFRAIFKNQVLSTGDVIKNLDNACDYRLRFRKHISIKKDFGVLKVTPVIYVNENKEGNVFQLSQYSKCNYCSYKCLAVGCSCNNTWAMPL